MNNDKNRQENKKAIKKFIPIVIISAIVGGVIGACASSEGIVDSLRMVSIVIENVLFVSMPWIIIINCVAGFAATIYIYRNSCKNYQSNLPADKGEDMEEAVFNEIDHKLSIGMMILAICLIVNFVIFGAMVSNLARYAATYGILMFVSFIIFVITNFGLAKMQQIYVDFVKIMYPEKQGSVYDPKFNEKWEESCDELEKLIIYKASYKAYKTNTFACCIAMVAMILLSLFFSFGPLPAMVVGAIWMATTVSYSLEAMKLEKEKINM